MIDEKPPIRMGLIGCGAFGLFCLDAYSKLGSIQPVAVADVRQNVAEEFAREFGLEYALGDPAELIAMDAVDMVHIATPPASHYDLVLQAVRAGKHVLCEKPLAMSVQQADEMLKAAWDASCICPVNFILRYNHVSRAVRRVIESGVLGQVLSSRLTNCASDSSLSKGHWFWDKSVSGGIFIEHGVHFFDLYRQWLGEGHVISSHTELRPGTNQEDRVMCTVRHDSGAVVNHYHGFDQVAQLDRTNHRLVCEQGDIWIDGWIPLHMTIDAALDGEAIERLKELVPGGDFSVVEEFDEDRQQVTSRGRTRHVTRRVRLHYCPTENKQQVYSESVQELMADQARFIQDRSHDREVIEINGREALALAQAAATMAR